MNNLERYLNNATRGIWGKRKLEIQEELHNDILERTRRLQLLGFDESQAVAKALEELGDPRILRAGMGRIYLIPKIVQWFLLTLPFEFVLFLILQTVTAQVLVSPTYNPQGGVFRLFLDVKSFATDLQNAGLTVNVSTSGLEMKLAGKRAYIPWTQYNSRVLKGKQELDIWNAFGALERAGIEIKHVNETEKLAYRINDTDIFLNTDSAVSKSWNTSFAERWATSYLSFYASNKAIMGQSYQKKFSLKTSDMAKLEGQFPQFARKMITATVVFHDVQNTPIKTKISTYTTIQKINESGEVQLELPAGKYQVSTVENPGFDLISNRIKSKTKIDGVILLGIRNNNWLQTAPASFKLLSTKFKTLTLVPAKTLQIR